MKNRRKRTNEKVKSPTCLASELCITVQQMFQKSVALKDNMLIIIALGPESGAIQQETQCFSRGYNPSVSRGQVW